MDSFLQAIGQGITGFVEGSFAVAGQAVRGLVGALDAALPGGLLVALLFVGLVITAWQLAKR